MSRWTLAPLEGRIADALRALHAASLESRAFYTQAAGRVAEEGVRQLFLEVATQRGEHAERLAAHLGLGPGADEPHLSLRDAARLGWRRLRGVLERGDAAALLRESQREEEHLKRSYDAALDASLVAAVGSKTSALLRSHSVDVLFTQDRVCFWLGQFAVPDHDARH